MLLVQIGKEAKAALAKTRAVIFLMSQARSKLDDVKSFTELNGKRQILNGIEVFVQIM